MSGSTMIVVCYDISDDQRRSRVADVLENYGVRVQYSVFECNLTDDELSKLKSTVESLIMESDDHVRYYSLCGKDRRRIHVDGRGQVSKDPDYHIV